MITSTVVSAEPFSHGTGTLRCLQKEMATYRHWSVSLWRDPDDVSHCRILSRDKTEWRLISATLCWWRRCFVADQLWFMTRIREEEDDHPVTTVLTHCVLKVPLNTNRPTSCTSKWTDNKIGSTYLFSVCINKSYGNDLRFIWGLIVKELTIN